MTLCGETVEVTMCPGGQGWGPALPPFSEPLPCLLPYLMNESDSMGYTYTETIFSVYLNSDLTGHFVFLFANLAALLTPQRASGNQDSWPGPRQPHEEAI